MIETESKQEQQIEWLKTYTLTPEQVKQLFQNKIRRAEVATQLLQKREGASFDDA
jgi:hypothetical protein